MAASTPHDLARETYPWLFREPDPRQVARVVAEDARRTLAATTLPAGYVPALDGNDDR
jgi:hypothetical protein